MQSDEIREAFLNFFQGKEHKVIPSSPLVLPWDPTVLFTTAGMQQFKPYFEGRAEPPSRRMTSAQKCFRTSDIDRVGDNSHLTFFEMLGNFSIGDYFKSEAVALAWEFVTRVLGLPAEQLWTTVFLEDDEAFDLWLSHGVPKEHIRRYGETDNYWIASEVGPCGPCSEIYYDFGEQYGCGSACEPVHDQCGRFLEIWNLVFMSYFQQPDGSREPLPQANVDTGTGLERLSAVMIHRGGGWKEKRPPSAYDSDLFRPIIECIAGLSRHDYGVDETTDRALRVVAEHSRAIVFLIGDERMPTVPSSGERGYPARRLIRRAVYFGRQNLGVRKPFLAEVAEAVITRMSAAYPELSNQHEFILNSIVPEELQFQRTLSRGLESLEGTLDSLLTSEARMLSGHDVFRLHDTYGFPFDVTREIVQQRGFVIDKAGFQAEMEKQRHKARGSAKAREMASASAHRLDVGNMDTTFTGYEALRAETMISAVFVAGEPRNIAKEGEVVEVALSKTPFYPEGGGQVGDQGRIVGPKGRVSVEDTQWVAGRVIIQRGIVMKGTIATGEAVLADVDQPHRRNTMRNHTATHLLHAALRQILGTHVRQKGSLVAPDRLRFDFIQPEAVSQDQMVEVEKLVNCKIRSNLPVTVRNSKFDEAISDGVLAFFGDAYAEEVRVVEVRSEVAGGGLTGRFSAELCGGTHCQYTGEIGLFLLVGESSIGTGIRRLEAVTGAAAEDYVREHLATMDEMSRELSVPREEIASKLSTLLAVQDGQRRTVERLERLLASRVIHGSGRPVEGKASVTQTHGEAGEMVIDELMVRFQEIDAPTEQSLRFMGDSLRQELKAGSVVLGAVIDGRVVFLGVSGSIAIERGLRANDLVREVSRAAGGSGGGRSDMAWGGAKNQDRLREALRQVPVIAQQILRGK